MARSIEEVEAEWRAAVDQEEISTVARLVRELLTEHPNTALSCELRYQRGLLTLTEGEGTGMERIARAQAEFEEGVKAGEQSTQHAEPWLTLNRTQLAVCKARVGNIDPLEGTIQAIIAAKPRTPVGVGSIGTLTDLLAQEGKEREAKKYRTQLLSYTRGLVRENTEGPTHHLARFLLGQVLLTSEYANEGKELLKELSQLDEETLGSELYTDIQQAAAAL